MSAMEASADLIPSYRAYEITARLLQPVITMLGGYSVHNVEALRPLEDQAMILAPNHRSNWDSLILGEAMYNLHALTENATAVPLTSRPINYMAKDTLWNVPGLNQLATACGAFAVERDRGVGLDNQQVSHISRLLEKNAALCIFPEGHRYKKDVETVEREKLKTTIGFLALRHGITVVPIGIAGQPEGHRLSSTLFKLPRAIVFGEPIHVDRLSDDGSEEFRREKYALVDRIHAGIELNYQKARHLTSAA